jgi:broad specificity phosphatase PhoE
MTVSHMFRHIPRENRCSLLIPFRALLCERTLLLTLVLRTGPIDPTEGVDHAIAIANCIASAADKPTVVYASPFLRTTETAHRIAQACGCPVHIEEGLTEWQTPSLLVDEAGNRTQPKSTSALALLYATVNADYVSVNPADGSKDAPEFPESEEALLRRCAKTMRELLHITKGNLCIVSHAPCDQGIAYWLEGAASPKTSKLTAWPLGGITKFRCGALELYGNTSRMPGIYEPGIKSWSLPCLEK